MLKVIKIVRIHEDHRDVEKPEYLTFANKEQMETYRGYLIRTSNAQNVFFTYEEC